MRSEGRRCTEATHHGNGTSNNAKNWFDAHKLGGNNTGPVLDYDPDGAENKEYEDADTTFFEDLDGGHEADGGKKGQHQYSL